MTYMSLYYPSFLLHCLLETELMWTHTPVALWHPNEWMCSEWLSNHDTLGIANIAQHNMHGTKSIVKSLVDVNPHLTVRPKCMCVIIYAWNLVNSLFCPWDVPDVCDQILILHIALMVKLIQCSLFYGGEHNLTTIPILFACFLRFGHSYICLVTFLKFLITCLLFMITSEMSVKYVKL